MDYESLSSDDLKQLLDDPHFQDVSQRVKIRDELARRNREEQAELARRNREEQKDRRWPRADKIAIGIFIVTVLTFFATFDWFHSDKPTAVPKPQGSSAEPTKPTEPAQKPTEPATTPSNPKPLVNPHDEQRGVHFATGATPQRKIDTLDAAKNERKLKGCIWSEGGQSALVQKSGRTVNLTGSDVSAYNGHAVTVHGMWESGASAKVSSSSSATTAKAGKTFSVTSVDMTSENCAK